MGQNYLSINKRTESNEMINDIGSVKSRRLISLLQISIVGGGPLLNGFIKPTRDSENLERENSGQKKSFEILLRKGQSI